jgi:hypothetical protein
MKSYKFLEPSILIKFHDLDIHVDVNLEDLVKRFSKLELIYFALEIIYKTELSKGYQNFCRRIFPADNGQSAINFIKRHSNPVDNLVQQHIVSVQTGIELLRYIFSISFDTNPWDFANLKNGYYIKGCSLFAIVALINERIVNGTVELSDNSNEKQVIALSVASTHIENVDFSNFDISTAPLIYIWKATLFFEFCMENKTLSQYIPQLLSDYGCADIRTYISFIARLFCENSNGANNYCRFVFSDEDPAPKFFNSLSNDINCIIDENDNVDYKAFRAKPLIRIDTNEYVIINVSFLFNKLYTSPIFDLVRLSNGKDDVRQIISTYFTEKKLLYPLLGSFLYPKSPFHLSGAQCNIIDADRAPDYYVRNWNNIFLVELKDYSFRADIKTCCSAKKISEYLYHQFVVKTNGKDGAIKQLIYNISKILDRDFKWDSKIDKIKRLYPILIVGNSIYSNYGITYILNNFFRAELSKQGISNNSITDLIVIDIDSLILFNESFATGSIDFKKYVDSYIEAIHKKPKPSKNLSKCLFSFMEPFPAYLKRLSGMDSTHLANKIKTLNTWIN